MTQEITAGTILIDNNALLPGELHFESETCIPCCKLVKSLNAYAFDRETHKVGWTFFCLAAEMKTTVLGLDRQKMIRRAIERILVKTKPEGFNSLEITRVTYVGSERFKVVCYVTVSARARHVQKSMFLRSITEPE